MDSSFHKAIFSSLYNTLDHQKWISTKDSKNEKKLTSLSTKNKKQYIMNNINEVDEPVYS